MMPQTMMLNQYEASLAMLDDIARQCPELQWANVVGNLTFSQIAFHALFYTDYYLGHEKTPLRQQPFHQEHTDYFADYEELLPRPQTHFYDQPTSLEYINHCRSKAQHVLASEDDRKLQGPSGFTRHNFSRLEMHLYNVRHLQHHVGQLSLALRRDSKIGTRWQGSGWHE